MLEAIAIDVDEVGRPASVVEGARAALRLRPDQLDELLPRLRGLMARYPTADQCLAAEPNEGGPSAIPIALHRRQVPDRRNGAEALSADQGQR